MGMNSLSLNAQKVEGIILGLIVAIILILSPLPPAFAIVVGIIFGIVAFFILNECKKKR
jgi:xanthosine utilization system XapX-like protein